MNRPELESIARAMVARGRGILAADESGCAWVQLGADSVAISRARVPRVMGLNQGARVVEDGLVIRAVPPAGGENEKQVPSKSARATSAPHAALSSVSRHACAAAGT